MVVSQEMLASQVGADILSRGGNAIDAAVATGFALAVTHQSGQSWWWWFMMIHLAEENKTIALDYEMAPAEAGRDMFLNQAGEVDNKRLGSVLNQLVYQALLRVYFTPMTITVF